MTTIKDAILDRDERQLVILLLREYAKNNADYRQYSGNISISAQLQFEIANRALQVMNVQPELPTPPSAQKK